MTIAPALSVLHFHLAVFCKMVGGWTASEAYVVIYKFFALVKGLLPEAAALIQRMGLPMDEAELTVINRFLLACILFRWGHSCLIDRCECSRKPV